MHKIEKLLEKDHLRHEDMKLIYQRNHDETKATRNSLSFALSTFFSSKQKPVYLFRKNLFMKKHLVNSLFDKLLSTNDEDYSYIRQHDAELIGELLDIPRDQFVETPNNLLTSHVFIDANTDRIGIEVNPLLYPELFNRIAMDIQTNDLRNKDVLHYNDIEIIMNGGSVSYGMPYHDASFYLDHEKRSYIILWDDGSYYCGQEKENFSRVFLRHTH